MEILEEQEDALKSVPGLVKMTSTARSERGEITLEFEVGTAIEEALVRASNRLSQVPRYPEAAREPAINTSNNAGPPLAVITIKGIDGRNVDAYRTWVDKRILPRPSGSAGSPGSWSAAAASASSTSTSIRSPWRPAASRSRGSRRRSAASSVTSRAATSPRQAPLPGADAGRPGRP
ncbi:MAG: efflux RND transporter permease subunit [Myxococcales bacterium]|nr:efflux RND transporter permease subunit [Myxococcales bacterium]